MKIIIGAFDKIDIKLLSYENLFHHMDYRILQIALKVKSAQKIAKKKFKKVQIWFPLEVMAFYNIQQKSCTYAVNVFSPYFCIQYFPYQCRKRCVPKLDPSKKSPRCKSSCVTFAASFCVTIGANAVFARCNCV